MRKFLIYFFIFFISSPLLSEGVSNYFPNQSGAFGEHLSIVKDLRENIESAIKSSYRATGSEIFQKVAPATVLIRTSDGQGSGFLINKENHVVTNYHVIQRGISVSDNIMLAFCPTDSNVKIQNSHFYDASVVKYDKKRDLALLKINSPINKRVIAVLEADESNLLVGMDAHAIGHPIGRYCTYTRGYVSQIEKSFVWGPYDSGGTRHRANVIQTQTPINPGNSGGPLINDRIKIIGMNTFIDPEGRGINFAVASSEINDFIKNYPINKPTSEPPCNEEGGWITKKCKCTIDEPFYKEDTNNNGIDDYFLYDGNCNNIPDMATYDDDEDGKAESIFVDKNENKKYELFISFDLHKEGKFKGEYFARYLYDEDENGEYEEVCFDVDMDEQIDECRGIS